MKLNYPISSILGALFLLGASCGSPHGPATAESLPPVSVETRQVQTREVPVFEEVMGTVVPRQQADVAAKLTGRLLEMKAVPGMRVKAGDVLAVLEVGEIEAALTRAEAALTRADQDLDRYRNLRTTGAATQDELEQVESRQRIASANVAETKSLLANAEVTAPFDGTITRKFQQPGDLATPGKPIFSLEDASLLRLEINVAQSLAGQIELGNTLRVEVAGASVEASVTEIAPSADVGSRTFSVKLDLPENPSLRAGQFGRAFLPRGSRSALDVPDTALFSRGQIDYLFVADVGTAHLRIVRTGESLKGETEILAGLDDGESIVIAPPHELRDGQPLTDK